MATKSAVNKTSRVVGDNVRRLREESGKTPSELAAQIGIGRMFLWEIETQRKTPSLVTLGKIANALSEALHREITPSDLLTPKKGKQRIGKEPLPPLGHRNGSSTLVSNGNGHSKKLEKRRA